MVEYANGAYDLADLLHAAGHIRRIAYDELALGRLLARLDAAHLAVLAAHDLVHRLVQHVRAAVDGAQASEALRQLAKAVQRIQVRRLAVADQRLAVQLDALDGLLGRLRQVAANKNSSTKM